MSYPILYKPTAVADGSIYTNLGYGLLADCVSCVVTEERNGEYEVKIEYPINGIHFSDIAVDCLIKCKPNELSEMQIFHIYNVEKPIDGVSTIQAEHISYLLNKTACFPFSAESAGAAFSSIGNYVKWDSSNPNFPTFPFSFWTDNETTGAYTMEVPNTVRSLLGGTDGSILDVFGGEYEFDNFSVKLHKERGQDNGVSLRYGKNITDLNASNDISSVYTGILPYWKGTLTKEVYDADKGEMTTESYDVVVYLDDAIEWSEYETSYAYPMCNIVDFSSEIESDFADVKDNDGNITYYTAESDIRTQLKTLAENYVTSNKGWEPTDNIKVSFINLWNTPEYENFAALERVSLCDRVNVVYPDLGIDVSMEVITTEYNVLLDRYDSIELGEPKSSMTSSVINSSSNTANKITEVDANYKSDLKKAQTIITAALNGEVENLIKEIASASEDVKQFSQGLIDALSGGLGSYVYFDRNANGGITAIYVLSNEDKSKAQYQWRWDSVGFAHSSDYGQNFSDVAILMNGSINANYILTGTLKAAVLKGTTIASSDGTMTIDMGSNTFMMNNGGTFQINDTNGNKKVAMQEGSSGWGFYADTVETEKLYVHSKGGSAYDTYISVGGNQGWEINTQQVTFRTTASKAGGAIWGGSGDGALSIYSGTTMVWGFKEMSSSDERLKTNIQDVTDDIRKFILGLDLKSFEYTANPGETKYGFIAQSVLNLPWVPEGFVTTARSPLAGDEDQTEYYHLSYTGLIPFMVAMLQQQDKRITKLEEMLNGSNVES